MGRHEIIRILRDSAAELHDLGLAKLFLFGSTARGEAQARDVDLLFEAQDMPGFSLLSQAAAMNRLEDLLGRPVDLVERRCLHPRIKDRVEAEMVEIF